MQKCKPVYSAFFMCRGCSEARWLAWSSAARLCWGLGSSWNQETEPESRETWSSEAQRSSHSPSALRSKPLCTSACWESPAAEHHCSTDREQLRSAEPDSDWALHKHTHTQTQTQTTDTHTHTDTHTQTHIYGIHLVVIDYFCLSFVNKIYFITLVLIMQ